MALSRRLRIHLMLLIRPTTRNPASVGLTISAKAPANTLLRSIAPGSRQFNRRRSPLQPPAVRRLPCGKSRIL